MALDPAVSDQLTLLAITSAQNGGALTQALDRNLVQGLGVINSTLIQQHGGVADDPPVFGALNTAAGVPQSGFVKGT